jgi:hypothetical protein
MLNSNPAGAPGFQNAEVYEQISWDGGAAGSHRSVVHTISLLTIDSRGYGDRSGRHRR